MIKLLQYMLISIVWVLSGFIVMAAGIVIVSYVADTIQNPIIACLTVSTLLGAFLGLILWAMSNDQ